MSTSIHDRVEAFTDHLRTGDVLGAFEKYYADDVSMQENRNEPVVGKDANRAREQAFVDSVAEWKHFDIKAIGVDEATGVSFMETDFAFKAKDGSDAHYQQVAVQRWKDGKIVQEQFYYDSAG